MKVNPFAVSPTAQSKERNSGSPSEVLDYYSSYEKRLVGHVISVSVGPAKGDTIGHLGVRLGQDETPGTMDESLGADILGKITESISKMWAEKIMVSVEIFGIFPTYSIHQQPQPPDNSNPAGPPKNVRIVHPVLLNQQLKNLPPIETVVFQKPLRT